MTINLTLAPCLSIWAKPGGVGTCIAILPIEVFTQKTLSPEIERKEARNVSGDSVNTSIEAPTLISAHVWLSTHEQYSLKTEGICQQYFVIIVQVFDRNELLSVLVI